MSQAETEISRNLSGVTLTKKGEKYLADNPLPPPDGQAAPPAAFAPSGVPDTGRPGKTRHRPALARGGSIRKANAAARLSIGKAARP